MSEKGYNFIQVKENGEKDFSGVAEGDVVLLPAFGASIQEMQLLNDKYATMISLFFVNLAQCLKSWKWISHNSTSVPLVHELSVDYVF